MLTENIMHDCVFKLLRTKDSETLECLCLLLTTIGKELETSKAKVITTFKDLISVVDKLTKYFIYLSENTLLHSVQNLHEMSKSIFWAKQKKNI